MEGLVNEFGPLTVEQRVLIGIGAFLVAFVLLVLLTRVLFLSLRASILLWLGVILVALGALVFLPVDTDGLTADPDPASDYATALARFEAMKASNPEPLNPLCEPYLLGHGDKTATVVVLMHGVSSCPRAFVDFAPILFEKGHNVLVVRMPRNGYADRSTDALRRLTAEDLAEFGDTSVDIAAGLGEDVVVLGISAGGTVAAWAAQNRREVDRAVLVAPFFGLAGFGPWVNIVLMRAMLVMPDVSIWKDPVLRERFEGMPHAYQRQSTRGTGEIMRLGFATYRQAVERAPAAGEIAVVTNDADTAVSNTVTEAFVKRWLADGAQVATYEFPAEHGLGHELIDPLEPGADPALTYPVILQAIENPSGLTGIAALPAR